MSNIEPRLAYKYAEINLSTNKCTGVYTSIDEEQSDDNYAYIPIPTLSNAYLRKYYLNGAFYEDAAGTVYLGKYNIDGVWYEDFEGTIPSSSAE